MDQQTFQLVTFLFGLLVSAVATLFTMWMRRSDKRHDDHEETLRNHNNLIMKNESAIELNTKQDELFRANLEKNFSDVKAMVKDSIGEMKGMVKECTDEVKELRKDIFNHKLQNHE